MADAVTMLDIMARVALVEARVGALEARLHDLERRSRDDIQHALRAFDAALPGRVRCIVDSPRPRTRFGDQAGRVYWAGDSQMALSSDGRVTITAPIMEVSGET